MRERERERQTHTHRERERGRERESRYFMGLHVVRYFNFNRVMLYVLLLLIYKLLDNRYLSRDT